MGVKDEIAIGALARYRGKGDVAADSAYDALAAALARPATPAALDVERLARVFAAHHGPSYFPGLFDVTVFGKTPREVAETIAREYAALSALEVERE